MPHVPRSQLLLVVVALVVALAVAGRRLAMERGAPSAPAPAVGTAPTGADGSAPPAGESGTGVSLEEAPGTGTLVHVAGAVRRPGVYRLRTEARVRDAVRRAGGPTRGADVNAINLAALVQDGVQVVVPRRVAPGAEPPARTAGATGAAPSAPVNLNSATPEQLDSLDGIGPVTAEKILEYRAQRGGFRSVDDLGEVPGIGPKTLEGLRDHVTV